MVEVNFGQENMKWNISRPRVFGQPVKNMLMATFANDWEKMMSKVVEERVKQ